MSPRPIPVLAVVVVLATAGTLLLLGRGNGERSAPSPAGTAGEAGVAPVAPAGTQSREGRVEIAVRCVGKLVPLRDDEPVPCRLVQNGRLVPCAVEVVAGPEPRSDAGYRGRHLVRFVLADDSALWRVVDLSGEPRDVEQFAPNLLEGQVIDEDGRPVAGAHVWTGATATDRTPVDAITDADGRFVATGIPGTRGVPVVVRAPGHASHWRTVDLEYPQNRPLLLQLTTASTLEVLAVDGEARPVSVVVWPRSDDLEIRHYPFFWSVVDPSTRVPDASGVLRIADLPRGSRVGVGLPSAPMEDVLLRESMSRVVVRPWPANVTGRLLDPHGEPRADTPVLLTSGLPAAAPGHLLPCRDVAEFVADPEGRFSVRVPRDSPVELRIAIDQHFAMSISASAGDDLGDLVLGAAPAGVEPGEPALRLRLPEPGGRGWLAGLEGIGELRWLSARLVAVVLPEPCVVDIDVRAGSAGAAQWRGMPVAGPVPLSLTP